LQPEYLIKKNGCMQKIFTDLSDSSKRKANYFGNRQAKLTENTTNQQLGAQIPRSKNKKHNLRKAFTKKMDRTRSHVKLCSKHH
jgi:hypothetical protein